MPAPMMVYGAAQLGASLLQGVMGSRANKKASKRAKEIGGMNYAELMGRAEREQDLGTLELLNLLEQQAQHRGMVEGMYAKSGQLLTGSPQAAMTEMDRDYAQNFDQAQESVTERVDRIRFQAKMAKLGAASTADAYDERAKGDIFGAGFGMAQGATNFMRGWGNMFPAQNAATPKTMGMDLTSQWDKLFPNFNPSMNSINLLAKWDK